MADNQHIKCKKNNGKRRQIAEILHFNRKSGSANSIAVASDFIAGTPPVDKTLSRTITKTILFLDWKKPSSWLVGKKTLGLDTSQIVVITLFAKVEISERRKHHNFVRWTNIFLNF